MFHGDSTEVGEEAVKITGEVLDAVAMCLGGRVGIRVVKLKHKDQYWRNRARSFTVRRDSLEEAEGDSGTEEASPAVRSLR